MYANANDGIEYGELTIPSGGVPSEFSPRMVNTNLSASRMGVCVNSTVDYPYNVSHEHACMAAQNPSELDNQDQPQMMQQQPIATIAQLPPMPPAANDAHPCAGMSDITSDTDC